MYINVSIIDYKIIKIKRKINLNSLTNNEKYQN